MRTYAGAAAQDSERLAADRAWVRWGRAAAVTKVLTPRGTLIQSFGDGSRWFGPVGNILKAVALNALAGQTLKPFTAKVTARPTPRSATSSNPGTSLR